MLVEKGIILAGGSGTRLYPLTVAVSKQLMPVYDKPMIYYPLSTLMSAGVRDVLIITTPHDQAQFQQLLGDGSQWGMKISYAVQPTPDGIAQAFIIAKEFLDGKECMLILGDNIFYGNGLQWELRQAMTENQGATVFGYRVSNPQVYGVIEFDDDGIISIEEKPMSPKSNYAVTGLYIYDESVIERALSLNPSARGELEITDLNNLYLSQKKLSVRILDRGNAWLDTGTHESLMQAANFIQTIQTRQGLMVACPEEIALTNGWINVDDVVRQVKPSSYGSYLLDLAKRIS